MSILPRKFYYKLHSGKNSKLAYYIGSYVAISWPRPLLSLLYKCEMKALERRTDKEYIMDRVGYYNKLKADTPFDRKRRVNQQVQNYKTCLKNSHLGVEKFNFSLGLSFNFFCIDIILLSV